MYAFERAHPRYCGTVCLWMLHTYRNVVESITISTMLPPEPELARTPTPFVSNAPPPLPATTPPLPASTLPVPDAKVQVPMIVEDSIFHTTPTPILLPPSKVLTEEEREMSVEQWIRREISLSYDKLMADGQTQILLFKEKAADIRRRIDGL
ncbi:hypothetical protein EDD15DRAFT_1182248 [Pisolithus albus]|nr:hypothetical protein EDD15DRAFT_1182248 [Pisolithus albus]